MTWSWAFVVPTAMFAVFTGFLLLNGVRSKSAIKKLRGQLEADEIRTREAAAETAKRQHQPVQDEFERLVASR